MLGARSCPRTPDDGSAPPEGPEDRTTHARGDLRTAPLTLGGTRGPHHSPQGDPETTPLTPSKGQGTTPHTPEGPRDHTTHAQGTRKPHHTPQGDPETTPLTLEEGPGDHTTHPRGTQRAHHAPRDPGGYATHSSEGPRSPHHSS